MGMRVPSSFHEHFAALTDPRCPCAPNSRHLLMDILVIAVCAVISGAEGWEDIEEYGKAQADWFADLLDLPHGIPGHDTFRRVLSQLDPEELTQCFIAWTQALSEASGGEIVSIDGKTLRHSFDQATATAAIHMVSAWASANRLVLGQLKVEEKSNEAHIGFQGRRCEDGVHSPHPMSHPMTGVQCCRSISSIWSMMCSVIRPSASCAGQMASRAPLVSRNRSSSVALMTRNLPGSAMSVMTVTHALMI